MKIGIIGAGAIGGAIAELGTDVGHRVMIRSRRPVALAALADGIGCDSGTVDANARLATQGTGSSVMATTVNTGVSLLTLLLIVSALYFAGLVPSRPQGDWDSSLRRILRRTSSTS